LDWVVGAGGADADDCEGWGVSWEG